MINLFMAGFWLLVLVAIFGWQYLHPEEQRLTIFGSRYSLGWAALLFCVYNVLRWWSSRIARPQATSLRARQREHRQEPPDRTPDPNFIFTDEPPQDGDIGQPRSP